MTPDPPRRPARRRLAAALVAGAAGLTLTAALRPPRPSAPLTTLTVLAERPHDPGSFTEGLSLDAGQLLESRGLVGRGGLQLGPVGAPATRRRALPDPRQFGEGAARLGARLYQLTWTGPVYVYDARNWALIRVQPTDQDGWGLTSDGQALIQSDGSAALTWRDPDSWAVTRRLTVRDHGRPVTRLNELEWTPQALYANVWLTRRLARIDPASGQVTAWLDLAPLARRAAQLARAQGRPLGREDVANGVAYDAARGRLLLTGKRWPLLFEVSADFTRAEDAARYTDRHPRE